MKKPIKIFAFVAALVMILIIATIVFLTFSSTGEAIKTVRKNKLSEYSYSSGGDMIGSHYNQTIRLYDENHALMSVSSAAWYDDDGKTDEYLIDKAILHDIENVFRGHHMYHWGNRKFTRMFVADGASYSYEFIFGDERIHFSSQYYPMRYRKCLNEIDLVIEKYSDSMEKIPGLVISECPEDDEYKSHDPVPGEITFEVYRYCDCMIYCRVMNGTEEILVYSPELTLRNIDTGEEIPVINSEYSSEYEVNAGETYTGKTEVRDLLAPGHYCLESGDLSAEFEIE